MSITAHIMSLLTELLGEDAVYGPGIVPPEVPTRAYVVLRPQPATPRERRVSGDAGQTRLVWLIQVISNAQDGVTDMANVVIWGLDGVRSEGALIRVEDAGEVLYDAEDATAWRWSVTLTLAAYGAAGA